MTELFSTCCVQGAHVCRTTQLPEGEFDSWAEDFLLQNICKLLHSMISFRHSVCCVNKEILEFQAIFLVHGIS